MNAQIILLFLVAMLRIPPVFGANDLEVLRAADKSLWLTSASCELLKKQVQALTGWAQRLGEGKKVLPACMPGPPGRYKISMAMAPRATIEYQGKTYRSTGTNCWSTALYFSKMLPMLRHITTDGEFPFYMESPLCAPVPLEKLEAGDLISISGHAYIYLTPELAFQKASEIGSDPIEFVRPYTIFYDNSFFRDNRPIPCELMSEPGCRPPSFPFLGYRCQSLAQFRQKHPDLLDAQEKGWESQLMIFEKQVQDVYAVKRGAEVSMEWRIEVKNKVEGLITKFTEHISSLDNSSRERAFLREAILRRLKGVIKLIHKNSEYSENGSESLFGKNR